MDTVKAEIKLETTECSACGIIFAMPDYFLNDLRVSGRKFCCPNGHSLWFGKSEADKLKIELKRAERQAKLYEQWYQAEQEDHQHTRRRLAATQGVVTKTKKRIANGVCPCCNRHFVNLHRHMETKHPDYSSETEDAG